MAPTTAPWIQGLVLVGIFMEFPFTAGERPFSPAERPVFARYSSDYVEQERAAIDAHRGVHAHDCEKAWDWRAQQRR
jgi:hypothetical protein